ncbi:formin-binding protein [Coemansia aciculifera]|nr:formin-binding protein [Coemansia aciculifera]
MSSAGMHNMAAPSPQMGARPGSVMTGHYNQLPPPSTVAAGTPPNVYRSATPVQQSPQYINNNMVNRPPTQMSHIPQQPPIVHMQQQQQQQQQRAPSVMGNNNGGYHPHQQLYHHHRSASRVDVGAPSPAPPLTAAPAGGGSSSLDSGRDIKFYVKVLYDYDAENDKELTIRDGDVISVLDVSADGWWEGEMTDRRTGRPVQGTFPSNFTEPISNIV